MINRYTLISFAHVPIHLLLLRISLVVGWKSCNYIKILLYSNWSNCMVEFHECKILGIFLYKELSNASLDPACC